MKVKIRFFTTLRDLVGLSEEEINLEDDLTLADIIDFIAKKHGEEARNYLYRDGEIRKAGPSIYLLVNGRNSRLLKGLKTKIRDGDVIDIIPISTVTGG